MDIQFTDHVIDRYRQRVAPGLTRADVVRRLQAHAMHAKVDGDAYASAKRVLMPDCVMVVKSRGDYRDYRYTAITCYARVAPESRDFVPMAGEDMDVVGALLMEADRRAGEAIPCQSSDEAEAMPLDELRDVCNRLGALRDVELHHHARVKLWLDRPDYLSQLDTGEVALVRAAATSAGRRVSLINHALSRLGPALRRRQHDQTMADEDHRNAVVRAAILLTLGRAGVNEVQAALDALCALSPNWRETRRAMAEAATGPE